jgi:hypothetical protein
MKMPGFGRAFLFALSALGRRISAFSGEVEAGSREENASKQKVRSPVLIQSEPERL